MRPQRRQKRSWTLIIVIFLIGILIGALIGYFYDLVASQVGGETIRLEMVYGSEKRGWVEEIAPLFEDWWEDEFPEVQLDVFFRPLGSRESMISVITGGIKPTIWSPASTVWIPLANLMWAEERGTSETLVTEWETFIYSPVIIGTSIGLTEKLAVEPESYHPSPIISPCFEINCR